MMNILIIGNPNSVWIFNYIKNILCESKYRVHVLYYEEIRDVFLDYYLKHNICIIGLPSSGKKNCQFMRGIKIRFRLFKYKFNKYFSFIHVHYVTSNSLKLACFAKWKNCKMIVTPWGSDVFRASHKEFFLRKRYLSQVDLITIQSDKILAKYIEEYGDQYWNKYLTNLKMGIDIFDSLDNVILKYSVNECKLMFDIEPSKITIAIGYNGSPWQQHLKVLNEIKSLPQNYKDKICLILHISYSKGPKEYIDSLRTSLEECGCSYKLLEDFLVGEKLSAFRYATDFFVHAQTTDEYSATVQEYLYCGTKVFNPSWIEYPEYKDNGIRYYEYKNFSDINEMVCQAIDRYEYDAKRECDCSLALKKLSAWNEYIEAWRDVYNR